MKILALTNAHRESSHQPTEILASKNSQKDIRERGGLESSGSNIPEPEEEDSEYIGSRPWPERLKDENTESRVFAFLVGINAYNSPVPKLKGCVKDVEQIEAYLKACYGNSDDAAKTSAAGEGSPIQVVVDGKLHLCTLLDRDATYTNIIRGFREHLCNATEKDTVWFHFSGHGCEQYTAKEFLQSTDASGNVISIEPNGKDQTLVCYKPPGTSEPQFLADKELAVLLNEVTSSRSKKGQSPHLVVSVDACHSGSVTREYQEDPELSIRTYVSDQPPTREEAERAMRGEDDKKKGPAIRTLDSYLDGFYTDRESLEVPVSEHVLLSACETIETAGDLPRGGVFTCSLVLALEAARKEGRNLHYAQLFTQSRSLAHRIRNKQNPQFETIGGFDPYTCFLEGWPLGTPAQYEVFQQGASWYVRCGAIHGLPTNGKSEIKIKLVNAKNGQLAGYGFAEKVGAQHSKLSFADGTTLNARENYLGEILSLPANPIYVRISGDKETADALTSAWDSSKNILLAPESTIPAIEVIASKKGDFTINEVDSGRKFSEIPAESGDGSMTARIGLVLEGINKIVNWMRTIKLDNPATKIRNKFDFELLVTDKNGDMTAYKDEELKIVGSEDNLLDDKFLGFNFRVTLKDNSQDLFFYAFDLSSGCAIIFRNDEQKIARADNMRVGDTMMLRSGPYGWGFGDRDTEITRWFKLFVTTEELDYHQLVQKGLTGTRDDEAESFEPEAISDDWCATTMKVTMVRG